MGQTAGGAGRLCRVHPGAAAAGSGGGVDSELQRLHEDASLAMGELEGVSRGMAPDRLLYMREATGRARDRAWIYQRQLDLLDAGTRT